MNEAYIHCFLCLATSYISRERPIYSFPKITMHEFIETEKVELGSEYASRACSTWTLTMSLFPASDATEAGV